MAFQLKQIIAWSSPIIPDGWAICNGQIVGSITTPDLRNKFLRCTNTVGELLTTGEALTHTHTFNSPATSSDGNHSHGAFTTNSSGGSSSANSANLGAPTTTRSTNTHSHTIFLSANSSTGAHQHTLGESGAETNLPRHIKLLFIMKVE